MLRQWFESQCFNCNTAAKAHKSLGPIFRSVSEGETPPFPTHTPKYFQLGQGQTVKETQYSLFLLYSFDCVINWYVFTHNRVSHVV